MSLPAIYGEILSPHPSGREVARQLAEAFEFKPYLSGVFVWVNTQTGKVWLNVGNSAQADEIERICDDAVGKENVSVHFGQDPLGYGWHLIPLGRDMDRPLFFARSIDKALKNEAEEEDDREGDRHRSHFMIRLPERFRAKLLAMKKRKHADSIVEVVEDAVDKLGTGVDPAKLKMARSRDEAVLSRDLDSVLRLKQAAPAGGIFIEGVFHPGGTVIPDNWTGEVPMKKESSKKPLSVGFLRGILAKRKTR
jgi:hypothetical protein